MDKSEIGINSHDELLQLDVKFWRSRSPLERIEDEIDKVKVKIISLEKLKINKKAAYRFNDLDDLEKLQS